MPRHATHLPIGSLCLPGGVAASRQLKPWPSRGKLLLELANQIGKHLDRGELLIPPLFTHKE